MKIRSAEPADLESIKDLLLSENLPLEGVEQHLGQFIVARDEDRLIGVVGLERYGKVGLLRSLTVAADHRRRQIGAELCRRLMRRAAALGVDELYLLTETAEHFFSRLGFRRCPRDRVPEAIARTAEFSRLCPATAALMMQRARADLDLDE
ncbi:MAG: GNAT family N-acetyltransferase [Acidobacteriota bacterium]|nr:MAG: GNAT family N-acetyltransferase [Acidobacteriota bacterium]